MVIIIILIRWRIWQEKHRMREVAESVIEKMKKRNPSPRIPKTKYQSVKREDDFEDEEKWIMSLYDTLW